MKFTFKDLLYFTLSYSLGILFFGIYGARVCPLLEHIGTATLVQEMLIPCLVMLLARILFIEYYKERSLQTQKMLSAGFTFFTMDLVLWTISGLCIAAYHYNTYQSPLDSNLKVIIGCMAIGFYCGTYSLVRIEHITIDSVQNPKDLKSLSGNSFNSVGTRFLTFMIVSFVLSGAAGTLVVYKGFLWLSMQMDTEVSVKALDLGGYVSIAKELGYILSGLALASLVIVNQIRKTYEVILEKYHNSITAVEEGDYDVCVPIFRHDEFGVMGSWINHLVKNLKQKEELRKTFGKYINPNLAEKIIQNDRKSLSGTRESLTIMFSDIRNFTQISEKMLPEELVQHLNQYFALIGKVINENQGVVDKFIGDASLSLYGIKEQSHGCDHAVRTALHIQKALALFNQEQALQGKPKLITGLGLHCGDAVMGNIGSLERLEYTVTGDPVNVAARIESLTKDLDRSVLISEAVYKNLGSELQELFEHVGEKCVKGVSQRLQLYGPKENWLELSARSESLRTS